MLGNVQVDGAVHAEGERDDARLDHAPGTARIWFGLPVRSFRRVAEDREAHG